MFPKFDPVGESVKRCPFLQALALTEGENFARDVAANFSRTGETHTAATAVETLDNVATNFRLFHGPDGALPLKNRPQPHAPTCAGATRALHPLPVASMSLSRFWSNFNPFKSGSGKGKPPKKPSRHHASGPQNHSPGTSGQCPMRRILGPLTATIMQGRVQCPKPIVVMRAALARTSAVRALRPESLEIKLLAVALTSVVLNIPFGMLREHTRKFSPQWFLVVHATIPFIAMFRKAVVMPPYAILFTVAAAVGGQAVGAKAEKARLQWLESQQDEDRMPIWAPAASCSTPRIRA